MKNTSTQLNIVSICVLTKGKWDTNPTEKYLQIPYVFKERPEQKKYIKCYTENDTCTVHFLTL